jgi:hypothetical protein
MSSMAINQLHRAAASIERMRACVLRLYHNAMQCNVPPVGVRRIPILDCD